MQQVSPTATRYDGPTIWFHWAVASLVLVQWLLAQAIDWFPLGMPRNGLTLSRKSNVIQLVTAVAPSSTNSRRPSTIETHTL
jgi:cytochrome b561